MDSQVSEQTLHLGDIVEEIATKRQGKLDVQNPAYWRVIFTDGKKPIYGIFEDEAALRLVSCPHAKGGSRFIPERSIMG
jgi:hypothetical protein